MNDDDIDLTWSIATGLPNTSYPTSIYAPTYCGTSNTTTIHSMNPYNPYPYNQWCDPNVASSVREFSFSKFIIGGISYHGLSHFMIEQCAKVLSFKKYESKIVVFVFNQAVAVIDFDNLPKCAKEDTFL